MPLQYLCASDRGGVAIEITVLKIVVSGVFCLYVILKYSLLHEEIKSKLLRTFSGKYGHLKFGMVT